MQESCMGRWLKICIAAEPGTVPQLLPGTMRGILYWHLQANTQTHGPWALSWATGQGKHRKTGDKRSGVSHETKQDSAHWS